MQVENQETEAPPEQTETPEPEAPEEKPPETEEPPPETEEPPAEAKADDAPDDSEEDETTPPPGEEEKRRRSRGGFNRKLERLERQNQILLEQLAGNRPQPPQQTPGKEKTAEEKAAEYIDSLVEQRLAKKEAEREQRETVAKFQEHTQAVKQAHPDFEEVLESVADIPVPQALQEALLTSEQGPAIMYQLAKNPAELARISALRPFEAAREIGRFEAKLASGATPPKPKPSAIRPPVPPTNVAGKKPSTGNLEDLPLAEYKRALRSKGR